MKQDKQEQAQVGKFHFVHLGVQLSQACGAHGWKGLWRCRTALLLTEMHLCECAPHRFPPVVALHASTMSWVQTSKHCHRIVTNTERIPLLALGGAYILYREQQLVSVRSMSGFWLRLRVDQHSYKWLNSQLRKLASSTAMAGTFVQAEWECSTAREGERHCYLPCCSWVLQEDSSWMPGGRFKFPWRSRCFQLPPTCFALESCWVQAVFLRAQYSQM